MSPSMMSQETEILSRVIRPDNPSFGDEAARSILALRLDDADVERINVLAAKARQGELSEEQEAQLDAYLFVGAVIDLMYSKARLSLERHAAGSNG